MDKVTRQCPQTTTFLKKKAAEAVSNRGPTAYQPNALPLGHTGSPVHPWDSCTALSHSQHRFSGTFLQTLPDLVTPLKGHSLFRAAVQQRGQRPPKGSDTNMTVEAT